MGIQEQIVASIFSAENVSTISISAFELRGSASFDLLSSPPLPPIKIMAAQRAEGPVYQDLSVHDVSSVEEAQRIISIGRALRLTRSTVKNDTSSRSVESPVQIIVYEAHWLAFVQVPFCVEDEGQSKE